MPIRGWRRTVRPAVRGRCAGRTVPVRRCGRGRDQSAGRVVRRGDSEVSAQDVEAQVDPGGGAGRREHTPLVDEQDVLVDVDERVFRRERPGVVPVRRGPPAVEQPRGGERERARRDGREPGAPPMGLDQRVDDGGRRVLAVRGPVAGDEDEFGPRELFEPVGHVVRQSVAAGHEAGFRAAHPHLVRHARPGCEHLRGNTDIEWFGTLEDENGDATQGGCRHGEEGTRAGGSCLSDVLARIVHAGRSRGAFAPAVHAGRPHRAFARGRSRARSSSTPSHTRM